MPTVDIPNPINKGIPSGGIGGIPTPLLLIAVGGGIGLVVFLTKKSGTPKDSQDGTLLPNTAIMLGSLQQDILETEGKVTTGNADLSNELSGVGSNLSLQLDTQSAGIAQSFSDLSTFLSTTTGTLQGQQDALASAIATVGTQNTSLATSLTHVLQGIGAVQSGIQTQQGAISSIISNQNAQSSTLNSLGQQVAAVSGPGATVAFDWNILNGKKLFSTKDQNFYTVDQGKVKVINWWDTTPGKTWSSVPTVNVDFSLMPYQTGMWQHPT